MPRPSDTGGISVEIDAYEWYLLSQRIKQFDPKLLTALRKRMRNAGTFAVEKIRRNLNEPSPDGGPDEGEMRALLSRATKVAISFGRKSAGVKVTTSSRSLPEEHRAVLRVYNKSDFRHPVFGNKDEWVSQRGRPYFAETFEDELVRYAQQEIQDALSEALAAIS